MINSSSGRMIIPYNYTNIVHCNNKREKYNNEDELIIDLLRVNRRVRPYVHDILYK